MRLFNCVRSIYSLCIFTKFGDKVQKPFTLGLFMLLVLVGCSSSKKSSEADTVSAPLVTAVTASDGRGRPSGGLRYDVNEFGYEEHEYFFEGTANAYSSEVGEPAPYRSRMIVWTPKDPSRFNGTTYVEWAHVSIGAFELTYELKTLSPMLEEQGFAFVLISAQERGVCGIEDEQCSANSLRGVDPERYDTLSHPGDDYSFDIFNQALHAIKYPSGVAPLGDLDTQFIIAGGYQPARYRNSVEDDPSRETLPYGGVGPLNGYLAHESSQVRLADAFLLDSAAPRVEPDEYPGPTLHLLDESAVRRVPAPNSSNHITWEVVGSTHIDRWSLDQFKVPAPGPLTPLLNRAEEEISRARFDDYGQAAGTVEVACSTQYPRQYALRAGLVALNEWLVTGIRPAEPAFIERVATPPESVTMKLVHDSYGTAVGGFRSPIIEVPVAGYNGEDCGITGTMSPYSTVQLAALYPTHQSYVEQLLVATDEAVANRTLNCSDAEIIMRKASTSVIGGSDMFTAVPMCSQ